MQIRTHRQITKINNDAWKARITLMEYASARTRWFAWKSVASTYRRKFWAKFVRFARYLTGRIVHCRPDNSASRFTARCKIWKIQRREINLWMLFAKIVTTPRCKLLRARREKYRCTRVVAPSSRISFVLRVIRFQAALGRCKFHVIIEISRLNR